MRILLCILFFCFSAMANEELQRARKADESLNTLIKLSIHQLKKHGYDNDAADIARGWKKHQGSVYRLVSRGVRNIGDFDPLSQFLAQAYDTIELRLGYQLCYSLRISDIKTLNYTIPVVFNPCSVDMDEYFMHFVHDDKYRGFAPVVAYWGSMGVCLAATYGAGVFAVCSPIAMAVELSVDKYIAPPMAERIHSRKCG